MDFDYTITTQKNPSLVAQALEQELTKAGFRILCTHDVRATLAEKGLEIGFMNIIEFCNAKAAYAVLKADPKMSLCLPCKISVYAQNNQTVISGMRPTVLPQFFPQANLGSLPQEIDEKIKAVIEAAK